MRRVGIVVGCLLAFPLFGQQLTTGCSTVVEGQVYDLESKSPLPFATVKIRQSAQGATTDNEGHFALNDVCGEDFDIEISFLGYKTIVHHHDPHHPKPNFFLAPNDLLLESIVIEETAVTSGMSSLSSTTLSGSFFEGHQSESFGELASRVAGVSMVSTGQNVAKPVIHGLYGNRVLIVNNDVRHEFQNWGTEHAPEIDPSLATSLQVIKGAATVRYGPNALGGVLKIAPEKPALNTPISGRLGLTGQSNGRSGETALRLNQGFEQISYQLQGNWSKQGDLRAPDYHLTNTGKEEHSYAASVRYHLPSWDFEGYYSRVFQKLGILRGSVTGNLVDLVQAMNNDEPLDTKSFSYSINQPYQETQHDLWKLKGTWATAQQSISFQYAYQANRRQEFDLRRGSAPSINLELFTHTIDMDWAHPEWGNLEGSLGVQWLYQDNNNLPGTNTVPFVPNFNNTRLGIFVVESLESGKTVFELGARWDYQFASTRGRLPNNDLYANKITTSNLTIALGVKREISPGVMFLSNLGTAWRPPDVGELYSFGRHQSRVEYGLWRYDIDEAGNVFNFDTNEREFVLFSEEDRPLKNERGAKWTNSIELEIGDWFLETTGYVNLIWNYYYLRPAGLTNTVRGAFPYFIFDQDDAFFTGIDLTGKLKHTSRMYSTLQASYVYARNISQNEYFVNIPPASLSYRINRQLGFSELELSASYVFRQFNAPRVITPQRILQAALDDEDLFGENNSIFDFQPAPDGYFLIDTAWSGKLGSLGWRLSIRNVLNARYRNYTDQLRYFADDLGRNLSVSLNYSW